MAIVIIHDFEPYVPPKGPATLPQPEITDIGKYLSVDSDVDLIYSSVENELPTPTAGDNGKFVGIDDAKYKILDVPTELPTVSSSDNGKVLGVVRSGTNYVWNKVTISSGSKAVIYGATISGTTATLSDSKTIGDIVSDINNGDIPYILIQGKYYSLCIYDGSTTLSFSNPFVQPNGALNVTTLTNSGANTFSVKTKVVDT